MIQFLMVLGASRFEAEALIRLFLAAICGGLIGLERELKGRPAGLKTFSIVCLGATLAMLTNEYISNRTGTGDLARMAAQVISGIGFLGAGTIMVTGRSQITGLTTAASLWVTASIGIAIGSGFYFGAISGVIILFAASFAYQAIDWAIRENSKVMKIYVEGEDEEFLREIIRYVDQHYMRIASLTRESEYKWFKDDVCATIELDLYHRQSHAGVLDDIKKIEGVRHIEEIHLH